jgi:hypothetical protein
MLINNSVVHGMCESFPNYSINRKAINSMIIYLYVKTHNKTGLKYLGVTSSKDPYKYSGSGVYWKNHLNKHGYDFSTLILKECKSKEEVKYFGLHYSKLWNIVEDSSWANLKEEQGDGGRQSKEVRDRIGKANKGRTPWNKGKSMWSEAERKLIGDRNRLRGPQSKDTVSRRVQKNKGQRRTPEQKEKMRNARALLDNTFTEQTKEKMSNSARKRGYNGYGFEKGHIPHNAKRYIIKDLDTGEIFEIISLRKWCNEHNISYGSMWKAFNENRSYKGFLQVNLCPKK